MQRYRQAPRRPTPPQIRIGLRAAHRAHGAGAAVLLVIGMQDEEDVERPRNRWMRHILRLHHLPQHVHEVLGVAQIVVGIDIRETDIVPVRHGRNRRHLADQPDDLVHAVLGIAHELGVRIHARQRRNRAHEHRHGMRRVTESLHEFLRGLVQHGVVRDVVNPLLEFLFGGQFAEHQQVCHFQKRAPLGQDLNRISAIAQDSLVSIDVGDAALARRRIHVRRVVGHQPEILRSALDLPQIHRPDRAVLDRNGIGLAGPIIGNTQCIFWHELFRL